MELPQIKALRDLVEQQQATLTDPAERDRAMASIEQSLYSILAAVRTYRGDAQVQMRGDGQQQQPSAE